MVQIKKEIVTKTFRDNDILIETTKQFHYTTEEEKMKHKKIMEANGYSDSGQVRDNIGTVMKPNYVFFGSYFKHEVCEKETVIEEVKIYTDV